MTGFEVRPYQQAPATAEPDLQRARHRSRRCRHGRWFGGDHLDRDKRLCLGLTQALLPFVKLPCAQPALPAEDAYTLATSSLFGDQASPACPLFLLLLLHTSSLRPN